MKHTPPPWELNKYEDFTGFSIWAQGRGCIAERWYDKDQESPYGDEIVANGRLISAAPDLLAALENLLMYGSFQQNGPVADAAALYAVAVVKKAKGQQ